MKIFQKLVSVAVPASCLVLAILPIVSSSSEKVKPVSNHSSKHSIHKLNPQLSFEIALHGVLLWASMGFLMPVGILTIRMSNREECGRRLKVLFYFHVFLQVGIMLSMVMVLGERLAWPPNHSIQNIQICSVLLATAGAVMSIRNFENSFNNNHQRIGLALYGVLWMQALIGFCRPQRGSKGRSVWYFAHWALGTGVSLLGIISIYTGLQAYHKKTLRNTRLWTILFTAEVSFIAFIYLFQDKWNYMKKQGVILGNEPITPTDQVISPRDNQKEMNVP